MKKAAESKFEIAEYRDGFGAYYVVVEKGQAKCLDSESDFNSRIRTKAEAKKALKVAEKAAQ